jgi:hypothetical protein
MSYRRAVKYMLLILAAVPAALLVTGCGKSQERAAAKMEDMAPQEINGWKATEKPEAFDRQTIFNYIDGAGEVYLAYNFAEVMVFHYSKPDNPDMTAEIFDMGSPEDAYGVFSHSRESEEPGIGHGYEYRSGVLFFWKGKYYVSAVADKETSESKEAVIALAKDIAGRIPEMGSRPKLVDVLPQDGLIPFSVRYFHVHSILNYHYFLSEENVLKLSKSTRAVLAQYQPGTTYLLCVEYPDEAAAADASVNFTSHYIPEANENGSAQTEEGKWTEIQVEGKYVIVVLDAPDEQSGQDLVAACAVNVKKQE